MPKAIIRQKNLIVGILLLALASCQIQPEPNPPQARPPQSAIASAHPLATQAGFDVLAKGGNAFDAGIAVAAVLGVVEPYSAGLGGGGFWLIQPVNGQPVMIDARETAPENLRVSHFYEENKFSRDKAINGPLAAGIPGQPAALVHLAKHYGRLPLSQTLSYAVEHARNGFETNSVYDQLLHWRAPVLQRFATAHHFLPSNATPDAVATIQQRDLAKTLEQLAQEGLQGFYAGQIARQLVSSVQAAGGVWTLEDLANYQIIERQPITGSYHDLKIITAAPPSSGGLLLINMLNMLEPFDLEKFDKVERIHLVAEVMRRAYKERAEHMGDPDFFPVPIEKLTDKHFAKTQMRNFQWDRATPSEVGQQTRQGTHTTHFSILDQEGNRLSATLSINLPFGSGFVAGNTGVLLNNELDDFSLDQEGANAYGLTGSGANALAPGKRPLSSMTPTFIEHRDWVGLVGTPGGSRIPTMVLLAILDAHSGTLPQSWVSTERFHHQYLPDVIEFEKDSLDEQSRLALEGKGHHIKVLDRHYGDMQAVLWTQGKDAKVYAASDPRRIGQARSAPVEAIGPTN